MRSLVFLVKILAALVVVLLMLTGYLLVDARGEECVSASYPLCGQDIEGYWFDPDQPGEGLSLEIQSGKAFLVYYHDNGYWSAAYLRLTGTAEDLDGAAMQGMTYYFPPGLRPIPLAGLGLVFDRNWSRLILDGALSGEFERYRIPEAL